MVFFLSRFLSQKSQNHVFDPKQGEYDSGQAFQEFLKHTDQKHKHEQLMDVLFSELITQDAIKKEDCVTFIDLACGDGQSSAEMVKNLGNHVFMVNYVGVDHDPRFVLSGAEVMHSMYGRSNVSAEIRREGIFDKMTSLEPSSNTIAYIGHALYYGGSKGERFDVLAANLERILLENAMCVTAHNGEHCELATIRAKVAKDVLPQPSAAFAEKAKAAGMSVTHQDTESTLRFPKLTPIERWNLSEPNRWKTHTRPEFSEALRLVGFVAQQALPNPENVMLSEKQKESPRLTPEELKTVVDGIYGLERDLKEPVLNVVSTYQILTPTKDRALDISRQAKEALANAVKSQYRTQHADVGKRQVAALAR